MFLENSSPSVCWALSSGPRGTRVSPVPRTQPKAGWFPVLAGTKWDQPHLSGEATSAERKQHSPFLTHPQAECQQCGGFLFLWKDLPAATSHGKEGERNPPVAAPSPQPPLGHPFQSQHLCCSRPTTILCQLELLSRSMHSG